MGISTGHDNPSSTPTDKISLYDKLAAIKQQKETNQKMPKMNPLLQFVIKSRSSKKCFSNRF